MNKKIKRRMVTIVMFLVLLLGSIELIGVANKIIKTSVELILIRDDIEFYNENPRKTDSMTKEAKEEIEYREKHFYQSEDWIVRTFSNMFGLIKILVLIGIMSIYVLIPCMWESVIRNLRREQRRRKMLSKKEAK